MAPVASLTRQMFTGEWALARARAPRTQNPDLQRDLLIKASDWLALLPRWPSGECLFAAAATHLAKKQSGAFRVCFFFSLTTLRNSLDEYTRPERNGILDRSHCRRGRTKVFFFFFPRTRPFFLSNEIGEVSIRVSIIPVHLSWLQPTELFLYRRPLVFLLIPPPPPQFDIFCLFLIPWFFFFFFFVFVSPQLSPFPIRIE